MFFEIAEEREWTNFAYFSKKYFILYKNRNLTFFNVFYEISEHRYMDDKFQREEDDYSAHRGNLNGSLRAWENNSKNRGKTAVMQIKSPPSNDRISHVCYLIGAKFLSFLNPVTVCILRPKVERHFGPVSIADQLSVRRTCLRIFVKACFEKH